MFRSATFKLTMWYLAIVMVISLIFSVVVYHFATGELSTGLNHQTQRIFHEFPVFNGNPSLIQHQDNDVAAGTHHIFWELAYFNLVVLVGAGFAGYFLARRTLEPIEAAHEQQKRFTADVSHELRTPLTALKMESEVALMDKQADKKALRDTLSSNLEEVGKMEQLINNLLRLTKLDDGTTHATFGPVQSDEIIQLASGQVAKAAASKKINLVISGEVGTIQADRDALVQLLVILLDNAIKYSPEGSEVTVTTSKTNQALQLSISDQGAGIAADALPHVFDRFYRADKARNKTETEGYGLGLSIAKMIADRHQATITLSSRPGKGTVASITLPLGPDMPTDEE